MTFVLNIDYHRSRQILVYNYYNITSKKSFDAVIRLIKVLYLVLFGYSDNHIVIRLEFIL